MCVGGGGGGSKIIEGIKFDNNYCQYYLLYSHTYMYTPLNYTEQVAYRVGGRHSMVVLCHLIVCCP